MNVIDAQNGIQRCKPAHYPFVMAGGINRDASIIAGGGMDNCVRLFAPDYSGANTPSPKAVLTDKSLESGSHDGYISQIQFLGDGT